MVFIFNSEVKIAYGYDKQFDYVYPMETKPMFVRNSSDIDSSWVLYSHKSKYFQLKLGHFLNANWLINLENELNIDLEKEDDYYNIYIAKYYENKECDEWENDFDIVSDYVSGIDYGLFMNIIMKKNKCFADINEIQFAKRLRDLLYDSSTLSPEQAEVKCYVVIGGIDKCEMTLKELIEFGNEDRYHNHLVRYEYSSGVEPLQPLEVKNEVKFIEFLKYLYLCYRDIEIQLEQCGYYSIQNVKSQSTFDEIIKDLHECIDEYKNMDKGNYFEMYQIMKKLFESYQIYLKHCILNRRDVLEGDNLPGDVDEIKSWINKINRSLFLEINGTYYRFDKPFIGTPNEGQSLDSIEMDMEEDEFKFKNFLTELYCFIQTMESKLKEVGYENIYEYVPSKSSTMRNIGVKLDRSIEEYQKMDKTSLLRMYPVIKKLYCSYEEYLKFCLNSGYRIDEGEALPGTTEEIEQWQERLVMWTLIKVGNQWQESYGVHLFTPCPDSSRNWLCSDCGDLMRIGIVRCKCNKHDFNKLHFTCTNDKHRKSIRKRLLTSLFNKLNEHEGRYDSEKNLKINEIKQNLQNSENRIEEIMRSMDELKELNLDGDTNSLIDKYIKCVF